MFFPITEEDLLDWIEQQKRRVQKSETQNVHMAVVVKIHGLRC